MSAELAEPFNQSGTGPKLPQLVILLRARDGDDCWICDKVMDFTLPRDHPQAPTLDHVQPKAAGGATVLANLRLAHGRPCNHDKGALWNGTDYAPIRRRRGKDESPVTVPDFPLTFPLLWAAHGEP
jgi:5-methylcytosine-specific restriction endonuclease McrA